MEGTGENGYELNCERRGTSRPADEWQRNGAAVVWFRPLWRERMSFWSGEKLLKELPQLIEPFDAKQIDSASYTLRVGPEVYVSPPSKAEALTRTRSRLDERQGFCVPSGQFAFLLTEEVVEVPKSALAFISIKARIKFRGLVNISGFHVDPGYRGRLVFSVFNAGPVPVHLARGDHCFLIWYASLDGESAYVRDSGGFERISSDLISAIGGEVQSLAGLSSRIDEVEAEQRIVSSRAMIAIGLLAALVSACAGALIGSWIG